MSNDHRSYVNGNIAWWLVSIFAGLFLSASVWWISDMRSDVDRIDGRQQERIAKLSAIEIQIESLRGDIKLLTEKINRIERKIDNSSTLNKSLP